MLDSRLTARLLDYAALKYNRRFRWTIARPEPQDCDFSPPFRAGFSAPEGSFFAFTKNICSFIIEITKRRKGGKGSWERNG